MQSKRHFQATLAGQALLLLATINSGRMAYAATGSPPPPTRTHYRFTTIDVPGAQFLSPVNLNNHGLVSGSYSASDGSGHGFLWYKGRVTVLDAPGATTTFANGNNDQGVVAGGYSDSTVQHAALYSVHDETWTQLPDIAGKPITWAGDINNRGACLGGAFEDGGLNIVGWIWDRKSYSFFSVPEASGAAWAGTWPQGINDRGQVTGYYVDDQGVNHGFLKDGSTITTFDVPGVDGTVPCSINNEGDIAGYYYFNTGEAYGFILHKGRFVTVGFPNSTLTGISTINECGELSGIYQARDGSWHGFMATPKL